MNKKSYSAIIIAACLLLAAASGCQPANNTSSTESSTKTEQSASDNSTKPSDEDSKENNENEESKEEVKTGFVDDEEDKAIPEIVDPTPDNEGEYYDGIFVYNGTAYELFYGDEDMAKNYADTISHVKEKLGDGIKVYNVIVPTHVGVDLPDKFSDICNPQESYINTILNSYSADIIGVSAYDDILRHRDEYIYFNTDHHWTGRGAYYAYKAFARAADFTPIKLSDMKSEKIEGYYGSLSWNISDGILKEDYVEYFTTDSDIDCTLYDEDGENPSDYSLIHSYASGSNAYGVFLGGDTPLLVAKNPDGNGKKIAIVKESYGNAFSPFIAYTYSETHMIDFRYVNFDLKSYLEANGIDEVIFVNNTMASATYVRCDEMMELVDSHPIYYAIDTTDTADDNEGGDYTEDNNYAYENNDGENNNDNDTETIDYDNYNYEDYIN